MRCGGFYWLLFITISVIAIPPLSLYRTVEQLQANISSLASTHPHFIHEACEEDPLIKYITLKAVNPPLPVPSVIITCNVHAHELITGELCVDIASHLQDHLLLNSIQVTILYVGNHNRDSVMAGGFCLRTNQNGIDLNRNFPLGFNTRTQGETYGGSDPLSESYSKCLDRLVDRFRPLVYLDIHSGQFSLIYFQQTGDTHPDPSIPLLQKIKETFCRNCRMANAQSLKVGGQAFEYLKYEKGVRYSNLLQIYGGYKAGLLQDELCFTIFNPLSERQLIYYREKWMEAIVSYMETIVEQEGEL